MTQPMNAGQKRRRLLNSTAFLIGLAAALPVAAQAETAGTTGAAASQSSDAVQKDAAQPSATAAGKTDKSSKEGKGDATAKPAADKGTGSVSEVVVTARRREEKAQDVPIPIAVLGGDLLAQTGTTDLGDIGNRLPSTNVAVMNPRQNSVSVRGLGNNPANDGLESSTGIFLDGVYLGRPGMAILDLSDLDQVELLRGPQGTLFGKNTTAGALNITTKKPAFKAGGEAEFTIGSDFDREFRSSITGPLAGSTVAGRLSVYDVQKDGVVDNVTTNGTVNSKSRSGLRSQLLGVAGDNLTLRLIADYHKQSASCCASVFYNAATPGFRNALTLLRNNGYHPAAVNLDPYSRETTNDANQKVKYVQGGTSLQADYDLGKGYQLTSISAYRYWNFSPFNDADNTSLNIIQGGVHNNDDQVSQELRISSPKNKSFQYTGGLYYFHQQQRTRQYTIYSGDPTLLNLWLFNGGNLAAANNYAGKVPTIDARLFTNSYAAFVQSDWHATDKLTLTTGLRNTYERKDMSLSRDLKGTNGAGVSSTESTDVSTIANNLATNIALDYKWNDSLNTYTSYTHGAKAGATNNSPPASLTLAHAGLIVQPEKANDVELGFKSTLFDRKVTFNANLFYNLIENYQATSVYVDPATNLAGSILTNTGWVRTQGVEVDSSAKLNKSLTLLWNGAYNDASYRSFRNGPCASEYGAAATAKCDLTGRQVVGAPRWTGSVTVDYRRNLLDDVVGYTDLTYAYRSSNFGLIDNSSASKIKGYGVADVKLGTQLKDGNIDLSVWSRNIFDEKYYTTMTIAATKGSYFGYAGDGRSFGATAKVKF